MAFNSKMLSDKPFKNVNKTFEDCTLKIRWDPQFNKAVYEAFKEGGELQQMLDAEVYKGMEPYVPRDWGNLYNQAQPIYGTGKIIFSTPYAMVQYNGFRESANGTVIFFENYSNNEGGLRGPEWFDRYKDDHEQEVVELLNKRAGEMLNGK